MKLLNPKTKDLPGNYVKIMVDKPNLGFAKAKDWAKLKANEIWIPLVYDSPHLSLKIKKQFSALSWKSVVINKKKNNTRSINIGIGTPQGARFVDNRRLEGPVTEMVDEAETYIMSAMR